MNKSKTKGKELLNDANKIGVLIREKRKSLGMTFEELSNAIRIPKDREKLLRKWESGEAEPSVLELQRILELFTLAPFKSPDQAPFKVIDLFAGIGGIRLGFHLTGKTQVVFSSEIDKFAAKTYSINYGEMPVGDITQVSNEQIPEHDILLAGFPCQAFSQAGKKLGFSDARGTLFFDVARIIQGKCPKAFLLENVKNLVSHDKGNTFKTILNILEELGYKVFYKVLKARDFGLPQNRERIYIVGFDPQQVAKWEEFTFPEVTGIETKVGDILEKKVDAKYTISDKLWEGHQRRKAEHLEKGNGFGYTLFDAQSPYTNTLSARYYKDGSEILIAQENNNPRKLTPREAARLQGFPEEFIIPVSDTQSYKQFGNSVSVPVINAIAKKMLEVLES
ncbi:DNA (cytosine-5-)-methyltransferase [Psittacicella gerlachiana]|uniref:Cytosine-specific methyltransferase n=1 Tax=Psittacicella gerlachiana TaxID=2028574 RepID=A0A3A1YDW6_9GAMM|nr:DNA (cytosine-5-)-methyltransferase [Psittacicella gerlachiana]RIY35380.1 DNA (cytosine-5-)-methyltransferase [Psittacicella gerlachiana]